MEEKNKIKMYVASPLDKDKRCNLFKAVEILRNKGYEVYNPVEHVITNAWDYPNGEWGLQVFTLDLNAIKNSDFVVALNYGRQGTSSGTTIEQGMAFMGGIKVILVEMPFTVEGDVQSLMTANARYATVKGLEGLSEYDFENPLPLRVDTEQK